MGTGTFLPRQLMSELGFLVVIPTEGGGCRDHAQHMIPVFQTVLIVGSTAADPDPTLFAHPGTSASVLMCTSNLGGKEFQVVV